MTQDLRAMIDAAKKEADILANQPITVMNDKGELVERAPKKTRETKKVAERVDPSDVAVAEDPATVAVVIKTLISVRAQKARLEQQEQALKDLLLPQFGELQYLALAEGDTPVISAVFTEALRVNSEAIKEQLPPEDNPELYTVTKSRALRVLS